MTDDEWTYDQGAEYDRILAQATGLLAQRGDEQAVALLVDVRSIALVDTDEVIRTAGMVEDIGNSDREEEECACADQGVPTPRELSGGSSGGPTLAACRRRSSVSRRAGVASRLPLRQIIINEVRWGTPEIAIGRRERPS